MAARPLHLFLALVIAVSTIGCVSAAPQGGQLPPVGAPAPGPVDPNAQPQQPGITMGQRAQGALEAMLMGAVLGAQFGPLGAAAGAGSMLIYGALTGSSPLGGLGGGGGGGGMGGYDPRGPEAQREAALEAELEGEVQRGDALEGEIEAELRRQEELLRQIEKQEAVQESAVAAIAPTVSDEELSERVDPRSAPRPPTDRDLPLAIFDEKQAVIKKGAWDNPKKLEVVRRSLDADRDGNAEQIRYFDKKSGKLIRKEQDRDYDGKSDTWQVYENGQVVSRKLDTNADGKTDVWETYAAGRMTSREIDRDNDGVRDAFYDYQGDSLVKERHDSNNDGKDDLVVQYSDKQRVIAVEDTNRDGTMDSWTSYKVVDGNEIMSRIERDTDSDGKRDVFETYKPKEGRPELARREEDKDGDGNVDVTSVYENGRLKSRQMNDPNLVPL